ncbi:CBS domain-containing protein [Pigmentiphaga sp. GD03639]|uniref:CBS domain-containing protein n=1 Tax=Pigmentiphaga daeguensis TaxID=414049 RepID=A0ABN1CME3_9BURK|nr:MULTISPECIES: CBS domain-containing protein [unclassified Pigmentiphaga]MDH2235823.1 CBS domain-containing protein [Pigmentiphaga sp. GD03639]
MIKVSEILRVKGDALYTASPDTPVAQVVDTMALQDIGSLVIMEFGELVGMLTFREIIRHLQANGGSLGTTTIRSIMDDAPVTVSPNTEVNEVRRLMLDKHARYIPVMDGRMLLGVISFYDVAKAVLEAQGFENRMLKAYIRDWPGEQRETEGTL